MKLFGLKELQLLVSGLSLCNSFVLCRCCPGNLLNQYRTIKLTITIIITPATDAEIIMKFTENAFWIGVVTCSFFSVWCCKICAYTRGDTLKVLNATWYQFSGDNALWICDVAFSLFPFGNVGYVLILEETLWRSWTLLDNNSGEDRSNIDWSRTVDCENTNDWRSKPGDKEVIDSIL